MRIPLGFLLALTLTASLTGCGGAGDEAAEPSYAQPEVLALVSQSDVGGEVTSEAVPVEKLEKSFTDDRMRTAIAEALESAELPEGTVPAGAVVAVGCEPPAKEDVEVTVEDSEVRLSADPVRTDRQCLVPVTTVALVAVAADLL